MTLKLFHLVIIAPQLCLSCFESVIIFSCMSIKNTLGKDQTKLQSSPKFPLFLTASFKGDDLVFLLH